MADEVVSNLGFDASDAINTLNQLAAGFEKYTQGIIKNAGSLEALNSDQKQFIDLLAKIQIQSQLTAGAIKELNGGIANTSKALQAAAQNTANNNAAAAAQQLKSQFDIGKASPEQLTSFTAALQTFQTRAAKAGLDAQTLNQIVAGTGQTFNGAAAGVNQAALNVQKLGQQFGQVAPQVNAAGASVNKFSTDIARLFEVFAFQTLLRGVGALTGALAQAVPQAIAFEKQIAAIATISDASDKNLATLSTRIIGLANEFGKPAAEVAAGFYQTLSNQVGNTDQSIQFFTQSLKLARATLGDVSDAVNALSGIQLSYGQSSAQAAHNADILFSVVDLGRVSLKELGDSLGRLNPLAAQLGVSTEEIGAAISVATQKGVNFRDAQTQILNLLTAALKPTEAFKTRLQELGFASAEAGIAAKGFIGFFTSIAEGAKTSSELAKLFQNIRGLRGELSLFGDDGKAVAAALKDIESRAGAATKAFETIQFTNAVNIESELNRIQNILISGFGHDVLAVLAKINTAFGGLANTIAIVAGTLAGLAALGTTVVIFNQVATAVTALATAFSVSAATIVLATGGIALAIGAAVAAFIAFRADLANADFVQATATKFEEVRKLVAKNATDEAEIVRQGQQAEVDTVTKATQGIISQEARKQQAFVQAQELATQLQRAETDSLENQLSARLRAFNSFQSSVRKIQDDGAQHQLQLLEQQKATELSINQQQFERFNSQFSEQTQAANLQTRFARLSNTAQSAFNKGDIKTGNDILQILQGIAKQYGDITGKTQLERRFLELNAAATQKQIDLNNQQIAQAKALEAANQPIVDEARRQLELAQGLLKELDKAQKAGDTVRVDALQKQILGITANIDKLGGKLTLGNLKVGDIKSTDVQNAVDALRKAVGGTPLEFNAKKGFEKVAADTKAFFESNPLVIEIGAKFDPKGFAEGQKQAQDLLKQFQAAVNAEQALPGLNDAANVAKTNFQRNLADLSKVTEIGANQILRSFIPLTSGQILDTEKAQQALQKFLDQTRGFEKDLQAVLNNPLSFDQNGNLTVDALRQIQTLKNNTQNQLADLAKTLPEQFQPALETFKAKFGEAFNAAVAGSRTLTEALKAQKQAQDAINQGQTAGETLKTQAPAQDEKAAAEAEKEFDQAIKDAAQSSRDLQAANTEATNNIVANELVQAESVSNVTNRLDILGQTGVIAGEEAAIGMQSIGSTALAQIPAVFALISALEELAAAGGGGGGGGGGESFASRGGRYFANGGFAPRGRDTIPAMLTPGEFVMNATSSRKFFSQLVAMNAGATPTFNANGGGVSNTFGDIHVNVTSGASGIDGRDIANAIRRELRRGTTRL